MKARMFIYILTAFVLGVEAEMYVNSSSFLLIALLSLFGILLVRVASDGYPIFRIFLVVIISVLFGMLLQSVRISPPCHIPVATLGGEVISFVEDHIDRKVFSLRYQKKCVAIVTWKGRTSISKGDYVVIPSQSYTFHPFSFGQKMDYEHSVIGYVDAKEVVLEIEAGRMSLSQIAQSFKDLLQQGMSSLSVDTSGLFSGMIFGGKSTLSPYILHAFTVAGIIHIVVLSGQNLSFLALYAARYSRLLLGFTLGTIVAGILVCAYGFLGGLEPPTLRAACMVCYMLLALLVGRNVGVGHALLICSLSMLLLSPHLLYSTSYVLSVLAMIGIVWVSPLCEYYLLRKKCSPAFAMYLAPIVGTQLFLLPYIVYISGTVSVYPLFANIAVLFIVPFILVIAPWYIIFSFTFPLLASVVAIPLQLLLDAIISIAEKIAQLPFSEIAMTLNPFTVGVWYVIAGLYIVLQHKRKRATPLALAALRDEYDCEKKQKIPWFDEHEGEPVNTISVACDGGGFAVSRAREEEKATEEDIVWD